MTMSPRPYLLVLLSCMLLGAAAVGALRARPAPPVDPTLAATRYDHAAPVPAGAPSFQHAVRPLLEQRCVVCHGCFDAPCQLKLSSWAGIARGLSSAPVYDGTRLTDAPTTRLGMDAQRASQWRGRGFSPVLDESPSSGPNPSPGDAAARALDRSLLWQTLQLKQAQPLPATPVLHARDFDFSLNRSAACSTREGYDAFARAHPQAGMPYGLPGLRPQELQLVSRWLQAGAPDEGLPPPPAAVQAQVQQWERFLNGQGLREQLMARYLYEHLFLGRLVFEGDGERHGFKLVRSATPPGPQPAQPVATRRPFDDPGLPRPWYRLVRDDETVLAKTHMPYVLSPARMARWRQWFLAGQAELTALPDYRSDSAANPFRTFAALPLQARYRFLLDDAGYFIMNFIKGPVCRGQIALNVIRDRFWVFFVDPESSADDDAAQALLRAGRVMKLPASEGPDAGLLAWREVARSEDELLALKTQALAQRYGGSRPITLDFIWRGDGHNTNAALTIFRHFDSATVERGLVGEPPLTAWVIGYPLLERIYYLLAAGFDVYGNMAHQLQTRLAMDFLRMEGEANFLMLLPQAARLPLRDRWYEGASDEVRQRVLGGAYRFDAESGVRYAPGKDVQLQLYAQLQQHLRGALDTRLALGPAQLPDAAERRGLQQLAAVRGAALQWLPEAVVLRVDAPGAAARYFSVLRNTAHRNVSTLLFEEAQLRPADNNLTVVPGIVGAYPNALWRARRDELPALAAAVAALRSEADYGALADRFAVRRTHPDFWSASDALMQAYREGQPDEAGLLDWSRLENR